MRSTTGSPRPSTQSVTPTLTTVPASGAFERRHHRVAVAELREVLRARVAEDGHRALFEIAGLVRVPARLFVPRPQVRRRGREDLEALGCTVHAGREREAVGPGLERAPVALVGDDRVRAAELPTRTQPGPVEGPVIRADAPCTRPKLSAAPSPYLEYPPRVKVRPIVEVSGRPMRRSDQQPVRRRSSVVPRTGSSSARYL